MRICGIKRVAFGLVDEVYDPCTARLWRLYCVYTDADSVDAQQNAEALRRACSVKRLDAQMLFHPFEKQW